MEHKFTFVSKRHFFILSYDQGYFCNLKYTQQTHYVMIMDFSKAFDKAAHYRLLTNLTAMESRGRLLAGSRTSSREGPNVSYLRGKFLARSWSALRKERWAYKSYVHPKLGYATIVHEPPHRHTHTKTNKLAWCPLVSWPPSQQLKRVRHVLPTQLAQPRHEKCWHPVNDGVQNLWCTRFSMAWLP